MGTRLLSLGALMLLALVGCATDEGPVATEAIYNLTCPAAPATCGSLVPETCLGSGGSRDIIGLNGEISCEENTPIIAICEATQTSDDRLILNLVASVGDLFAFELRGAAIEPDGTLTESSCEVTIIEDELAYGGDLGGCGAEEPSMEQPCQITNVVVSDDAGADLAFDIECQELISGTTGNAFDVGGPGGGPATIRFARCSGL